MFILFKITKVIVKINILPQCVKNKSIQQINEHVLSVLKLFSSLSHRKLF